MTAQSPSSYDFEFRSANHLPDQEISFKSISGESFLSFEQRRNNESSYNYLWNQIFNPRRLMGRVNCSQKASSVSYVNRNCDVAAFQGFLFSDASVVGDNDNGFHESAATPEAGNNHHKRPREGDQHSVSVKKQCTGASKKAKLAKASPAKDPQTIAAKNRRERISERLKTLQELVPNGSKVDLVTMLEKAVSYVKFLQLQVKILSTDEFWPDQGGKVPDISQVREAIDAILSSQRDGSSSSIER